MNEHESVGYIKWSAAAELSVGEILARVEAAVNGARMARAHEDVAEEVCETIKKFPPMRSAHEGYAIILEEMDELWDHVKVNQTRRDLAAMRREAIQIAAMATRFAAEVCCEERGRL